MSKCRFICYGVHRKKNSYYFYCEVLWKLYVLKMCIRPTVQTLVKHWTMWSLSVNKGPLVPGVGLTSGSGKKYPQLHFRRSDGFARFGKIFIQVKTFLQYTEDELALFRRRKVGLVYQFYNLIPNLSIEKNINLPLILDKPLIFNKQKIDKDKLMNLAEKLRHKKISWQFSAPGFQADSSKERQLHEAWVDARLLLADEPLPSNRP